MTVITTTAAAAAATTTTTKRIRACSVCLSVTFMHPAKAADNIHQH